MSKDQNFLFLIGRLVRDPEIKYTASGTAVSKFSIANNESIRSGNEYKDYVNYFDVITWGNQAINCEKYLKKGSQVAITGSLKQNRWQDKATGQTRSKIEINAHSVQFLGTASGNTGTNNYKPPANPYRNTTDKRKLNGTIDMKGPPTDELPPWEQENDAGLFQEEKDNENNSDLHFDPNDDNMQY